MMHTKNTGTVFARRATRRKRILLLQLADFNPHPHTEDDYSTMCLSLFPALLQSTSSHGGWHRKHTWTSCRLTLQSTSSHGGWRKGIKTIDKGGTLQSTSSHGGWLPITQHQQTCGWFQSTPSRGGWHARRFAGETAFKFQSTPSRGGWHDDFVPRLIVGDISIHTLAWRVTQMLQSYISQTLFQSTPSRGGWLAFKKARFT